MRNVFNCGIGFCLVVPQEVATLTVDLIAGASYGMRSWVIGQGELNKNEYRRRRRRGNWQNPVDAPLFSW